MEMLHCDELAYCIEKEWPFLVRGKAYWIAHPVDAKFRIQIGTAWIVQWEPVNPVQPNEAKLAALWAKYGEDAKEWHLANHLRGDRDFALQKSDADMAIAQDREDVERV